MASKTPSSGAGRPTAADLVAAVTAAGEPVAGFLTRQRWFAGKSRGVGSVRLRDWAVLDEERPLVLMLIDVDDERYFLPVAAGAADATQVVASARAGAAIEGHADDALARALLEVIRNRREIPAQAGRFVGRAMTPWTGPDTGAPLDARLLSGEQSNTSVALGGALILKTLRRPRPGVNPELEITQFLTERRFLHVPPLVGWMEYTHPAESPSTVVVVQGFVENQGDGWRFVLHALGHALDATPAPPDDVLLAELGELGRVTGALHVALASDPSRPDFAPERITPDDTARWGASIAGALDRVTAHLDRGTPGLREALAGLRPSPDRIAAIGAQLDALVRAGAHTTRVHGDYHLGQVLKTRDSFVVIDFEGEPGRPIDERRAKRSPLVDVAGMLRSLSYAAHSVARSRPESEQPRALAWLEAWEARARAAFLDGYAAAVAKSEVRLAPERREDLVAATAPFEIDKACYELEYELDNRPDWVPIPLAGLTRLLAPEGR